MFVPQHSRIQAGVAHKLGCYELAQTETPYKYLGKYEKNIQSLGG